MKETNPFFDLPINYGIVKKKEQKMGTKNMSYLEIVLPRKKEPGLPLLQLGFGKAAQR
jgi:hypothetical protein